MSTCHISKYAQLNSKKNVMIDMENKLADNYANNKTFHSEMTNCSLPLCWEAN